MPKIIKLYKIWTVQHQVKKEPIFKPSVHVIYDRNRLRKEYPLVEIIDVLPNTYLRENMVGTNLADIIDFCEYLNKIADSDIHYEIRSESVEV